MSNVGEDRNQQDQQTGDEPAPDKRPSKEVLKEAAHAASEAAHAAAGVVDTMLAALETGPSRIPQDPDADDPQPFDDDEADRALADEGADQAEDRDGLRSARPGQMGTGPAAQSTGHGMMRGGPRQGSRPAFEQFMAALSDPLRKAGERVRVTEIAGWVKIEGQQGHKVYIAKTVTGVSRVESTLDPELVRGAKAPDPGRRRNGRIASWIPARPESVAEAIGVLAKLDEPIRAPVRGPGGGGR